MVCFPFDSSCSSTTELQVLHRFSHFFQQRSMLELNVKNHDFWGSKVMCRLETCVLNQFEPMSALITMSLKANSEVPRLSAPTLVDISSMNNCKMIFNLYTVNLYIYSNFLLRNVQLIVHLKIIWSDTPLQGLRYLNKLISQNFSEFATGCWPSRIPQDPNLGTTFWIKIDQMNLSHQRIQIILVLYPRDPITLSDDDRGVQSPPQQGI